MTADAARMMAWIEEICDRGLRRPGYDADLWTEEFCARRFREIGLEDVRLEDVELFGWEPRLWSLEVDSKEVECFPLPHTAPGTVEGPLRPTSEARGAIAVERVTLSQWPTSFVRDRLALCAVDPEGAFDTLHHTLPFGRQLQAVMEPALARGAAGFVGIFDAPWESCSYYVPYDGIERPIPAVWVSRSDGALLEGAARARIHVESERRAVRTHNVVGVLPGSSDEWIVVGSHHDGPWASAVEDATGIALVLAQAELWAKTRVRPHNMLFLLNSGHMVAGAGCRAFLAAHRDLLPHVVLEVHLEHAARESRGEGGRLVTGPGPETAWWFVTPRDELVEAVRSALEAEGVTRSLLLPPDVFGQRPTTDGGFFHEAGVPLVNFLEAPMYLFDAEDTPDKVHMPSLEPVTRAAARIIQWTAGRRAADLQGT